MTELTGSERVARMLFYGLLLLLGYLVFRVFQPFLVPLGWAAVLVVLFYPWHVRLEKRWGKTAATAVSTVGVTLILIVPALLVMTAFVGEGVAAVRGLQRALGAGQLPWVQHAWEWIQQHAPGQKPSDVATLARESAEGVATYLASKAGAVLRNIAVFLFDLVVTVFAMFYLFRDAGSLLSGLHRILPLEQAHREEMIAEARELIFASVTSSLIVSGVHGLLGGLAFAVLGISAAVFWGVMMAFFALLPVVGAWMIWLPAAIWLMVNGEVGRGIVLLALAGGVAGVVDHFLRPALISGRTRLSGLLVFISVLGGIAVFGMLGVVLGPIVVATAASVLEVYTQSEKEKEAKRGEPEAVGSGRGAVLE